jgi:hypothetical protein
VPVGADEQLGEEEQWGGGATDRRACPRAAGWRGACATRPHGHGPRKGQELGFSTFPCFFTFVFYILFYLISKLDHKLKTR